MPTYSVTIDEASCWGCRTCEVACMQEHHTSEGVRLIRVTEDGPHMVDGKPSFVFRVTMCRHCDDPPCADACPEDAFDLRGDGIVVLVSERCTGCGACVDACPYGAVEMDHLAGVARKCNLCHHRIDAGLLPACADNVCLAHCIRFSDSDTLPRPQDQAVDRPGSPR